MEENNEIAQQVSSALFREAQTRYNQWNCNAQSADWPCNAATSHLSEGYRNQSYLQGLPPSSAAITTYASQIWEASRSVLHLLQ